MGDRPLPVWIALPLAAVLIALAIADLVGSLTCAQVHVHAREAGR